MPTLSLSKNQGSRAGIWDIYHMDAAFAVAGGTQFPSAPSSCTRQDSSPATAMVAKGRTINNGHEAEWLSRP